MTHAKPQDKSPGIVNIGEITRAYFEGLPVDQSRGYELLDEVSDEQLVLFDYLIRKTDIADKPTDQVYMCELQAKESDRKLLLNARRFDDDHPPIIALGVFALKPFETPDEFIESFGLFVDEGKGFRPINFQTSTSPEDTEAFALEHGLIGDADAVKDAVKDFLSQAAPKPKSATEAAVSDALSEQ